MALKIGVIGTADIAKRRMIPAIQDSKYFEYVGVAIASRDEWDKNISESEYKNLWEKKLVKANEFVNLFGGKVYEGYETLLQDKTIDAVYIPLPPAFHYFWVKKALEYGKHILVEKPATVKLEEIQELIDIAKDKDLSLVENYGFVFHNQFTQLKELYNSHVIGDLRLIRGAFGFPHRLATDFRYSKALGGGALLDCGGYVIKAASSFMNDPKVVSSHLTVTEGHEVDVYGSVTLRDSNGVEAQLSFGMDNSYKCEFELWGSKGSLLMPRAYTAPAGFNTIIKLFNQEGSQDIECGSDDQFLKILDLLYNCIENPKDRTDSFTSLLIQERLLDEIFNGEK